MRTCTTGQALIFSENSSSKTVHAFSVGKACSLVARRKLRHGCGCTPWLRGGTERGRVGLTHHPPLPPRPPPPRSQGRMKSPSPGPWQAGGQSPNGKAEKHAKTSNPKRLPSLLLPGNGDRYGFPLGLQNTIHHSAFCPKRIVPSRDLGRWTRPAAKVLSRIRFILHRGSGPHPEVTSAAARRPAKFDASSPGLGGGGIL